MSENEPLDAVFKLFMTCYHHMLLATDGGGTVTGLITLEDVMEEILQVRWGPLQLVRAAQLACSPCPGGVPGSELSLAA